MNLIRLFLKQIPVISLFLISCAGWKSDPWILIETQQGEYGYVNLRGDTVIRPGKYSFCYSDTLRKIGFVYTMEEGVVAINRNQKVLFRVFELDNGPDHPSEGLFRIIEDGKIGYANLEGEIVIEARYECAYPFENGEARVSLNCESVSDGEHKKWISEYWFYIDTEGKLVNPDI